MVRCCHHLTADIGIVGVCFLLLSALLAVVVVAVVFESDEPTFSTESSQRNQHGRTR